MASHLAHIARDHCLAPERADAPIYGGRYRLLFEGLPPLDVAESRLHALGQPGGPCDVGAEFSDDDRPDAEPAAVWPFFGQFIAHDITADRSPLGHRADPAQIHNFRTPKANLEGVYGAGPVGGTIFGEVLIGIIDADPESFRSVQPEWTPTLPAHTPGSFGLVDILVPAGEG